MENLIIKIVQLILCLSIIVIVHEFGHFLFARIFKIRVEKFYLFFDPWFSLFKFKPKNSDTEYGIGWLPIGGYVKISGMIDESLDSEQMKAEPQKWEFRSKPAWQRLLVMGGGVIFNFILALVIYSMMLFTWGDAVIDTSKLEDGMIFCEAVHKAGFKDGDIIQTVDGEKLTLPMGGMEYANAVVNFVGAKEIVVKRNNKDVIIKTPEDFDQIIKDKDQHPIFDFKRTTKVIVVDGSLAQQIGMKSEDMIHSINNVEVSTFDSLSYYINQCNDLTVPITYVRGNDTIFSEVSFGPQAQLGIMSNLRNAITQRSYSFFESFPAGLMNAVNMLKGYVNQMKYLFAKDGLSNLGGFGTIGSVFPTTWSWPAFWELTAFFSIAIGFLNILPIPALDGGHITFLLYEMITRRKPSDTFIMNAQVVGMILLLGLIIVANVNDIMRFLF